MTLGNARSDAGDQPGALSAFDEALIAAKESGDRHEIAHARSERRFSRQTLGMPEDADDRAAPEPRLDLDESEDLTVAVGWFPRDQHSAVLARWPELAEDLDDADGYCRGVERWLDDVARGTGRHPFIAPLTVEALVAHARHAGLDPAVASTRAGFAAELHRNGQTISWPPGRNDPCWCRSGRKYKRCCGA